MAAGSSRSLLVPLARALGAAMDGDCVHSVQRCPRFVPGVQPTLPFQAEDAFLPLIDEITTRRNRGAPHLRGANDLRMQTTTTDRPTGAAAAAHRQAAASTSTTPPTDAAPRTRRRHW